MNTTGNTPEFTITRTLRAPRDLVWSAWTETAHVAAWMRPFGVSSHTVSGDLRVGGRYRYTMVNDETGEEYPTGGEYLEVSPPERLVFTWGDIDAPVEGTPVVTLTLTEDKDGDTTELVFHLRGIAGQPGDNNVYDGWTEALENLALHLADVPPR